MTKVILTTSSWEKLINKLVDSEIKSIIADYEANDNSYIIDIFRIGFGGYDNFTADELITEACERNIDDLENLGAIIDAFELEFVGQTKEQVLAQFPQYN